MQTQFFGTLLHGGRCKLFATVGGAGRLRIYGNHIMPSGNQRVERWHGKFGCSHEGKTHRHFSFVRKPPKTRSMASQEIDALAQALSKLPGLGPRSARRVVLHLMKKRESVLMPLLRALEQVEQRLVVCDTCGNIDTGNPCGICIDPRRDIRSICVVEDVSDLWALDRSRLFPGKYHVLGGRLSALDGVRPEDLNIDGLVSRIAMGGVDEVVLAMNATLEGQTTAHYLAERLEQFPIRLTQLAHGVPVGGELDYLDDGTLAQALRARRPVG
jgi:recombination protein RecR